MNPHQNMLLDRFERLLKMADTYRQDLNTTGRLLIERCAIATFLDCIEAGCDEEADRMARNIGARP